MSTATISAHSSAPFASSYGAFALHAFEMATGERHGALVSGEPGNDGPVLLRLQSSCLTGVAFGAELCDCRQQLEMALEHIGSAPGVLIYLDQEGRSHGWVPKIQELALMRNDGLDTVDAAAALGIDVDRREYDSTATILQHLFGRVPEVRLLTNNPARLDQVKAAGVPVVERLPLQTAPTATNLPYLQVKRDRLGHLLDGLDGLG